MFGLSRRKLIDLDCRRTRWLLSLPGAKGDEPTPALIRNAIEGLTLLLIKSALEAHATCMRIVVDAGNSLTRVYVLGGFPPDSVIPRSEYSQYACLAAGKGFDDAPALPVSTPPASGDTEWGWVEFAPFDDAAAPSVIAYIIERSYVENAARVAPIRWRSRTVYAYLTLEGSGELRVDFETDMSASM